MVLDNVSQMAMAEQAAGIIAGCMPPLRALGPVLKPLLRRLVSPVKRYFARGQNPEAQNPSDGGAPRRNLARWSIGGGGALVRHPGGRDPYTIPGDEEHLTGQGNNTTDVELQEMPRSSSHDADADAETDPDEIKPASSHGPATEPAETF